MLPNETSASLLLQLRDPSGENHRQAWNQFVELYAPLILNWGLQKNLQPSDAQDLVQEVLIVMHQTLPNFEYDPEKRFRGYLFRVTRNKLSKMFRDRVIQTADGQLETAADPEESESGIFERQEYNAYVSRRSLELIKRHFPEVQWKACWMQVVDDRSAADVALALGITKNVAYLARSRVLARLKQDLAGLID
ncbi:MAG: RNA polymerase sigma factor [Rubripirellula sp.]